MNKLLIGSALALLAGCATSTTPDYDLRFGDAVRQARRMMTINPAASANPDPVAGIDSQAGREALARYHDSFKAPPPVVNVINVGAGPNK